MHLAKSTGILNVTNDNVSHTNFSVIWLSSQRYHFPFAFDNNIYDGHHLQNYCNFIISDISVLFSKRQAGSGKKTQPLICNSFFYFVFAESVIF